MDRHGKVIPPMVTIITGSTKKPMASQQLTTFFNTHNKWEGYLYIGYPILATVNGAYPIDALWVSREKGLVIFNLIEGKDSGGYEDAQDDAANKIEAKLKGYKDLMDKRNLLVEIHVITFAPAVIPLPLFDEEYPLCDEMTLEAVIETLSWNHPERYEKMLSILQAISTIRSSKTKRAIVNPESRGAKLKTLEDSIANLDSRQSEAVIQTVEGVQRIRGLAGSGKTIVLALKAAYLHAQHPDWNIAVTFNTRALKGQFRQLINTFHIEQTNEEPDWEHLHIIHAWGAPGGGEKNGLYYAFCCANGVDYSDFTAAKLRYGTRDPFGELCREALDAAKDMKQIYDAILVDEAQDFSPGFLRLCYELLTEPKRLVYAYDEMQNLRSLSLPSPEVIFGKSPDGSLRVKFHPAESGRPQQDIVLEKCYRNSRPTLVMAHALGFGIYRKPPVLGQSGLVQMFEQSSLWTDVGYEVADGQLKDGSHVVLKRTWDSSPEFLEDHSPIDDLIQFKSFDTQKQQDEWVASQIKINLQEDELRANDIIVINPDPVTTRKMTGPIRAMLFQERISSHMAGVDTTPDVFFSERNDSVAFTGIYRAKGNEAAMVYIINAQSCYYSPFDMEKIRNQLFTAITRSKAWVRVLGVGQEMEELIAEYQKVKEHDFTLDFTYPTKEERKKMNIVNRDMSEAEKNKVRANQGNVSSLIEELESGQIHLEDLGEDRLARLRSLLAKEGRVEE